MLNEVDRLFAHMEWADRLVVSGLTARAEVPTHVLRELGHILGANELWLSRLEHRESRSPVWPMLSLVEAAALAGSLHAGYSEYLATLDESALEKTAPYTNSAGQSFETPVRDILLHVAMHAQYHRGKLNLLLRQAGQEPIPTDYIAFVRGVPAAKTAVPNTGSSAG